jgi:ribonuclease P protein component
MLPKTRRIERKYFSHILSSGKRYNSQSFTLYISKIEDSSPKNHSRVAFSVSKKVVKTAVGRNKQRRRGYSAISKVYPTVKPGYFLFFVYKKGFEIDYSSLEKEISALLSHSLVII